MGWWKRFRDRWWEGEVVKRETSHTIFIGLEYPWPRRAWMWFEADFQRKPFGWIKALSAIAGTTIACLKLFHLIT